MTAAEARARIQFDTQWQRAPALTVAEVDDLLLRAQTADTAGVLPGGTGYAEAFTPASVRAAVVAGWLMKAGKAQYDVKAGTTEAKRSQMEGICRRQADAYGSRVGGARIGTISVASSLARY